MCLDLRKSLDDTSHNLWPHCHRHQTSTVPERESLNIWSLRWMAQWGVFSLVFIRATALLMYFLFARLNFGMLLTPYITWAIKLFSYTQQAIRNITYNELKVIIRFLALLNLESHKICELLTCITSAPVF